MKALETLILPGAVIVAFGGLYLLSDDRLCREQVIPAISGLSLGLCAIVCMRGILSNSQKLSEWIQINNGSQAELSVVILFLVALAALLVSSSVCGFIAGIFPAPYGLSRDSWQVHRVPFFPLFSSKRYLTLPDEER